MTRVMSIDVPISPSRPSQRWTSRPAPGAAKFVMRDAPLWLPPRPATGAHALRVLVAEDEPAVRLTISTIVERSGSACLLAEDGDQAWELWNSDQPDVVIADWEMPGISGAELVGRIRAAARPTSSHVIVVAGEAVHHTADDAFHAGADDVLFKPLQRRSLERLLVVAGRLVALNRSRAAEA